MTPSTVSPARRQRARASGRARQADEASRKRATRRRRLRRGLLVLVAMAVVGVIVVMTEPIARKAVNDLGLPLSHSSVIRQEAAAKHLPPALVAGVIYAETKFDARTSPAGAVGLMQIEPQTAQFLAKRSGATTFSTSDLNHPSINIAYGCYYLRYLLNEYHQKVVLALAAYNGGETNVDRWESSARAHGHDLKISEIPFPETRAYVSRVLHAAGEYRRKYSKQLGYG